MGLVNIVPMEIPERVKHPGYTTAPSKAELERIKLASERVFTQEEIEAEEKATKYSIKRCPRVKPIPGTIGFFVRNILGGNAAIIEHLKDLIDTDIPDNSGNARYYKLKNILILWNNADEYSRQRIDIFDIMCDEAKVRRRMFYGWINEALFDSTEEQVKMSLQLHKTDFIELLMKMAGEKRNGTDRRLLAEMMKLVNGGGPQVVVNNEGDRTVINTQNVLPSFLSSIRRNEVIAPNLGRKELSEGNQNYIDGEVVEDEEKVLVENRVKKWEIK